MGLFRNFVNRTRKPEGFLGKWLLKLLFQSERREPGACAAERTDLSQQAVASVQNHW